MKARILIDNTPSADEQLHAEHGLSILVKYLGKKILLDTGLTGKAMENAEKLGVDISAVDALVLSHGHNDHTGGLKRFFELNHKAPVYASPLIRQYEYASDRRGKWHSLSSDKAVIDAHPDRFIWTEKDTELFPGIHLVVCKSQGHRRPSGNKYLHIRLAAATAPYQADDELALVIQEGSQACILSSCTHSGLPDVLESCEGLNTPQTFIGGLHLLDEEVAADSPHELADYLNMHYPNLTIYTGHCTGRKAFLSLSARLGERIRLFKTGDVIETSEGIG